MASYLQMNKEQLAAEFEVVKKEYARLKSLGTALDKYYHQFSPCFLQVILT